jgi:hypothetical protein
LSFTLHRLARWPLVLALALATAAQAQCQAPLAAVLVERFLSADCETCWASGSVPEGDPFVLDWIVPSARGEEAPLSVAALEEARARVGALPPASALQRTRALPVRPGLSLEVQDGPAWNGYIALQLRVDSVGPVLPAGATGYLALVENVPAGEDGTPIARRLVRRLVGPLLLDAGHARTEHLRGLRVPEGARAQRLGAVGWVETASGEVIALARAIAPDCIPPS